MNEVTRLERAYDNLKERWVTAGPILVKTLKIMEGFLKGVSKEAVEFREQMNTPSDESFF